MQTLAALDRSVARLAQLARTLDDADVTGQAYPAEWTIAQTFSHLGSGAEIMRRRVESIIAGRELPGDFMQEVWDEWNARSPVAQRDDAGASDAALMAVLHGATDAQRAAFTMSLGPFELDFDGMIGMRLNEHALHTWDIAVAVDPAASLPQEVVPALLGNLDIPLRFGAKPTGVERTVAITTTDPERHISVAMSVDAVATDLDAADGPSDVTLPAESFVRLVYGRLDAAHTPLVGGDAEALDDVRAAFPGF
jgi:uncharacterized protein (TIGR03083 family)